MNNFNIDEPLNPNIVFKWGTAVLANVYHYGVPLKFRRIKKGTLTNYYNYFPDYTACGYKYKHKNKNYKKSHNHRNVKHPLNEWKDAAQYYIDKLEIRNTEFNLNDSNMYHLKRNSKIKNIWYYYEKHRSHKAGSWKLQKKRHRYD